MGREKWGTKWGEKSEAIKVGQREKWGTEWGVKSGVQSGARKVGRQKWGDISEA